MKIWCPRCNQGWVFEAHIKATLERLAICEECEASWIAGTPIAFETFVDMSTILRSKGLSGRWSDLVVHED